jgi:hypothetical protein
MELDALVKQAQAAPPMKRIDWRDPIAAHGTRAIAAVQPWLTDPALAAFAVRVIERVGADDHATEAVQVLRGARSNVPPFVRTDVDWALRHLRVEPAGANARTPRQP